mmetsp:Transcript_2105/g.1406  ORF Transcript_2105/g.1406 Transcript_2105/m.1406 type:complete len:92 (-) Transcript_2105:712-987(-)
MQVHEFLIDLGPHFPHGSSVCDHHTGLVGLSNVTARRDGGGSVGDAHLEASGAPGYELDGLLLALDHADAGVHVFGCHIPAVHQAACHVLA